MLARALAALVLVAALFSEAGAGEVVRFETASYRIGELQQRLGRERGDTELPARTSVIGYLTKPEGSGPFPAVISLHGCLGLTEYRRNAAEQLTASGYVSLAIDSFATRGIKDDCLAGLGDRQSDAVGALIYLSQQSFVDPRRIVLLGFAQGGTAALGLATARPSPIFDLPADLRFKAVAAFYPSCSAAGNELAVSALVLIGGLDDWSRAVECEWWALRRRGKGAPVRIEVYPEAYHGFDDPNLRIATRAFGHWMKYDAPAAAQAAAAMREFLAEQLK
jgi:dienelactone hydrolase